MKINIRTINHHKQRYATLGDYFYKDDTLHIKISDLGKSDYNFLILVHELIEEHLTKRKGILETQINKFDIDFENGRIEDSDLYDEPGDHPKAPYRREHRFAENIERLLAHEMGIDFNEYNNYLKSFFEKNNERKEIDPNIGK